MPSIDLYFQSSSGRGLGGRRRAPGQGGRGRMSGSALGPGGICYCSSCGYETSHKIGSPCYKMKCPKCGTSLSRH